MINTTPHDLHRAMVYRALLMRMGMKNMYVRIYSNHELVIDHKGDQYH
jgi:hypothetical protein